MKNITEIKNYWNERAAESGGNPSATTQDIFLRELEINTIVKSILRLRKKETVKVLDLGCGDGHSTLKVACEIEDAYFTGVDYSSQMIENAEKNLKEHTNLANKVSFKVADVNEIDKYFEKAEFDFVISDRCLINLESSEKQYDVIKKVHRLLKLGGVYLLIENFHEGQDELNKARIYMGLGEIKIRWHNHFFSQNEFLKETNNLFSKVDINDFSSAYYFATRVIYSKYCQLKNVEPDYNHELHKLAVDLPEYGSYSPIKLAVLNK